MSMGEELRQQAVYKYSHSYLRYQSLLSQLQAEGGGHGGDGALRLFMRQQCSVQLGGGRAEAPPAGTFLRGLSHEVARVHQFLAATLEQLWQRLLAATDDLRAEADEVVRLAGGSGGLQQVALERLEGTRAELDSIGEDVVLLERFAHQNIAAAAQLAQAHDAGCGADPPPLDELGGGYLSCMQQCLLGGHAVDPLLVGLSDAFELVRLVESDAAALQGESERWVPPSQFCRLTRKFWLHPSGVTAFKVAALKHLPILIFGDRQKLSEGDLTSLRFLSDQAGVSDSSDITSVYYDDPEAGLPSYHTRLRREDASTLVRVRWYGARSQSGGQQLFVERKVHREKWTNILSSKERAPLQQRHLPGFLAGQVVPGMEDPDRGQFLAETQALMTQGHKAPLIRTCYRRTAFQESSNNLVRISIDTELCMANELGAPRAPGDWCRDMSAPIGPGDLVHFPYAVVEIKLQAKPPPWVKSLVASGALLVVPKFSKFLHGVASLHQPRLTNTPHWFLPDEAHPECMTPATWEEMSDPSDAYYKEASNWLFPSSLDAAPPLILRLPRRLFGKKKNGRKQQAAAPPQPPAHARIDLPGGSAGICASANDPQLALTIDEFEAACEKLPDAELAAVPPEPQQYSMLQYGVCQAGASAGAAQRAAPGTLVPVPFIPGAASCGLEVAATAGGGFCQGGGCAGGHADGSPKESSNASTPAQQAGQPGASLHRHSPNSQSSLENRLQDLPPEQRASYMPDTGTSTPHSSDKDLEAGGGKAAPLAAPPGALGRSFASLSLQQLRPVRGSSKTIGGGAGSQPLLPASPGRAASLVRTRVEPKTFFANERTFLAWLQISVLVMLTSMSLLGGSLAGGGITGASTSGSSGCPSGDHRCLAMKIAGAIIAPVALLFMCYALFMYRKRTVQILRRQTVRYDDQTGPVLLVGILIAVMLTAYVISVIYIT